MALCCFCVGGICLTGADSCWVRPYQAFDLPFLCFLVSRCGTNQRSIRHSPLPNLHLLMVSSLLSAACFTMFSWEAQKKPRLWEQDFAPYEKIQKARCGHFFVFFSNLRCKNSEFISYDMSVSGYTNVNVVFRCLENLE